ncbi:helix-turn-helix domain-containing protein [Paenibacillus motobuensis]|uniref:helix-turn-helix domain-containing protein n=1 Tax=Paenibacillus TaxID=44249 RepID=UPI0020404534|nr:MULTISPECIES: helix-turn-helix transcriptional regulator [Paenibacillus]MCM3041681.1 helix-turn-helix domain-containing protein [Paenibacillus lutimineralis]MCM3648785.1 helix-turn-helix domain-containing protein [Paenibacillus motobuensis]
MSIINERIKERRLALDLTLLDVAEFLGVKEATAQRYESGDIKNIKHETIVRLAELFKCSPAYLMGWENELNPRTIKQAGTPYYALTEKDDRDIARDLERMLSDLESEESLAFNGQPMDDETRRLFAISLENSLRLAKEMSKKKFTPKKYRD